MKKVTMTFIVNDELEQEASNELAWGNNENAAAILSAGAETSYYDVADHIEDALEKVWVVTFLNDCEWELPNVSVNVFDTLEKARECLDKEWRTLTTEDEYDDEVSKKSDDDFLFEDHCANRTIGEIKEKEIR